MKKLLFTALLSATVVSGLGAMDFSNAKKHTLKRLDQIKKECLEDPTCQINRINNILSWDRKEHCANPKNQADIVCTNSEQYEYEKNLFKKALEKLKNQ